MKFIRSLKTILFLTLVASTGGWSQDLPKQQEPKQQEPKPQQPVKKAEEIEDLGKAGVFTTREVVVPVIVTDPYGRFVTGLKSTDFVLREDNRPQKIEDFSDATAPFSVALLLDLSLSTKNKLDDIKHTAIEFTKLLQPRDRVLVVAFDDKVRFIGDFTGDQKELEHSIKALKTGYLTSLYDAIDETIKTKLLKTTGRKAIVVMSDGVDSGSHHATYNSVLDLVASSGVIAYSVRYETRNDGSKQLSPRDLPRLDGGKVPRLFFQQPSAVQVQKPKDRDLVGIEFLQSLAARSGALYLRSESLAMTARALYMIADEIRNQYTLVYSPTNDATDGTFRRIQVNVGKQDLLIRSRQGYFAPRKSAESN